MEEGSSRESDIGRTLWSEPVTERSSLYLIKILGSEMGIYSLSKEVSVHSENLIEHFEFVYQGCLMFLRD